MSIIALALFGSCARRDDNAASDVDLLAVVEGGKRWNRSERRINTSFYGRRLLLSMSSEGNLFALHLVHEARTLYDGGHFFQGFRAAFRYKSSYESEIKEASDVGWFIFRRFREFQDGSIAARKVAWSVRTILIARAAENRQPIFAADALADFANSPAVRSLIKVKSEEMIPTKIIDDLGDFLLTFGAREPVAIKAGTLSDQMAYFQDERSGVALGLIKALTKGSHEPALY
jgi:predicted nucleotidyltransferase